MELGPPLNVDEEIRRHLNKDISDLNEKME